MWGPWTRLCNDKEASITAQSQWQWHSLTHFVTRSASFMFHSILPKRAHWATLCSLTGRETDLNSTSAKTDDRTAHGVHETDSFLSVVNSAGSTVGWPQNNYGTSLASVSPTVQGEEPWVRVRMKGSNTCRVLTGLPCIKAAFSKCSLLFWSPLLWLPNFEYLCCVRNLGSASVCLFAACPVHPISVLTLLLLLRAPSPFLNSQLGQA